MMIGSDILREVLDLFQEIFNVCHFLFCQKNFILVPLNSPFLLCKRAKLEYKISGFFHNGVLFFFFFLKRYIDNAFF